MLSSPFFILFFPCSAKPVPASAQMYMPFLPRMFFPSLFVWLAPSHPLLLANIRTDILPAPFPASTDLRAIGASHLALPKHPSDFSAKVNDWGASVATCICLFLTLHSHSSLFSFLFSLPKSSHFSLKGLQTLTKGSTLIKTSLEHHSPAVDDEQQLLQFPFLIKKKNE